MLKKNKDYDLLLLFLGSNNKSNKNNIFLILFGG